MRGLKWLWKRLEAPRSGLAVLAIALVLAAPALFASLFIDEYLQASRWKEGLGSFLNHCFVFCDGSRTEVQRELYDKLGAWWAAPDFKVAFWRPLSAATLAVDQLLWPRSSVMMHLHSLLWFAALLFAARALYARMHTGPVAALALALFAWDDARGHVLSWVAKRNALIAGVFGVLTLLAYDKWRRDGWRPGAWLAPVLLACGLFSAEAALATTGFLLAHALFLDQGSRTRRLVRLLPHAGVVAAWQVLYMAGGFGVKAPGFRYVHPLSQPLAYAAQLLEGAPLLVLGQLTPIASDIGGAFPTTVRLLVCVAAIALPIGAAWKCWPRLAAQPQTRFWLLGAVLSLLPVCASAPTDSNLLFVGLGVSPALAMLFADFVEHTPVSRWSRVLVGSLAAFNLVLAPLLLPPKCLFTRAMELVGAQADATIPSDRAVADKTLIVVSVAFDAHIPFIMGRRDFNGTPRPHQTRLLAVSAGEVAVTRVGDRALRVRPANGFFAAPMERMYNEPARRYRAGEVIEFPDMKVTIVEATGDGRPLAVEYSLAEPLESERWLWMKGQELGFVAWKPPEN